MYNNNRKLKGMKIRRETRIAGNFQVGSEEHAERPYLIRLSMC